ncbi:MAG: NADH-quinone oxidoreductase subunit L [Halioglobus sp.]
MAELFSVWILPLVYAAGCALAFIRSNNPWTAARVTVALALGATLSVALGTIAVSLLTPVDVDKLGLTAALLVSLLGWVIVNYSARYLDGEADQGRFVRSILFTLTAVSVLLVSRHLLVIVLAWSGTSIGLHFLLTHYQERKAAQIVAHKKFLVSRLAELCLVVALLLVYRATGTLALDGLGASIAQSVTLDAALHWAAVLIALAAILKSAQLPLHGWLIQVMEAPTPVSALLHAGVVNIGGFVLLRLAELIALAPAAQALLVIAGSLTALLAGLVMMTRISIKVRLAWSTCAQMGFMLMEVGLGLYELALLHLVAHSLYKAHAFLNAGDTVQLANSSNLVAAPATKRSPLWYLGSVALGATLVLVSAALWELILPTFSVPTVALLIVTLGLAPLMWLEQGTESALLLRGSVLTLALTQLYLLWHLLFAGLAPGAADASPVLVAWVLLCFGVLYIAQVWLRCHPQGRLANALYPWAYCGFYLDETFTRLTFKLWPAKLSPSQAQTLANRHPTYEGDAL